MQLACQEPTGPIGRQWKLWQQLWTPWMPYKHHIIMGSYNGIM